MSIKFIEPLIEILLMETSLKTADFVDFMFLMIQTFDGYYKFHQFSKETVCFLNLENQHTAHPQQTFPIKNFHSKLILPPSNSPPAPNILSSKTSRNLFSDMFMSVED
jgi:hypothetical protein